MSKSNAAPPVTFCSSCVYENKGLPNQPSSDLSFTISAPGKVILHGEHSVVYGKLAVAASLGLRTKLSFSELSSNDDQLNGSIKLELPALNLIHSYDINEIQNDLLNGPLPLTKSASNYNWKKPELLNHEELLRRVEEFVYETGGSAPLTLQQRVTLSTLFYLLTGIFGSVNLTIKPLAIKVESDLTISSGSGSSASFAVTVAAAFIQYLRLKSSEIQSKEISKNGYKSAKAVFTDLRKFDEEELDLISRWAFLAEKIIHGTPSGIDNTVCTYGSAVEFRKGAGPKLIRLSELNLLFVNTNVKRDTKRMVNDVVALRERHVQVVDSVLNSMDEVAQEAVDCLKQLNNATDTQSDLDSQGDFKVKEIYEKLAELTSINQNLLRALGVSHPMLEKICDIIKSAGLSGKLTGAGGGGYAIALIPPHVNYHTIKLLIEELNSEGFEAISTKLGGVGVTVN